MSNHLFMGAINKSSNDRESPKFAEKKIICVLAVRKMLYLKKVKLITQT
jgi:hypothetical protein